MEKERLAGAKKKARRERRILVFVDESGLSQRPHRCRTWAPRGQTPILQYNFNWKSLSVAAGLTLWNFYFRIYAGPIKKEQVVDFLAALVRHLDQPLLIVWDRLPGHRSRLVQEYIAGFQGWISTAYLPPGASVLFHIINSVTIIGFVGADPEQRQARNNNGSKFTVLSVATRRSWKNTDDEWASRTEWHRVRVIWNLSPGQTAG